MSKQIICTAAAARRQVKKAHGLKHVRYCFFVRPFLPTDEGKGFEGCGLVRVTKKEFISAIGNLLKTLEDRGARIELTIPTEDFESFIIG